MSKKIIEAYPGAMASRLIHELQNGPLTQNGDRTSGYFPVAKGTEGKLGKKVYVCLIEEKNSIPRCSWGYGLHVIDDVDGTDCSWFQTDSLKETALEEVLVDLFRILENGNPLP